MVEYNTTKIAVIVEDQGLQDYIVMLLVGEGYKVQPFSSQGQALAGLEKETVDLIIAEFSSAHINGLDICKVLRKNSLYNSVPIFFLIPDREPLNAARLIYAGADDYIKKSSIQDELFLKVKLNLYRVARQRQDVNPATKLPTQSGLVKELQKRIEIKEPFAIYYAQVYPLNDFIYRYGFEKADAVEKFTAALIFKTLRESGDASDFVAHYRPGEFIMLTLPEQADTISAKIISDFDQEIGRFYDEEDKNRGFCMLNNRYGENQKIHFLRLCIGVATNDYFPLFSPTRLIQIASEIKDLAHKLDKSMYIKEERKNYPLS